MKNCSIEKVVYGFKVVETMACQSFVRAGGYESFVIFIFFFLTMTF